jgi:predicted DNA-binding transcriptional regulator AlpA
MSSRYVSPDPALTAEQSADFAGCSLPTWWRGVASGRFPKPFYPAPRAPRWRQSEVLAALEATRMSPADAMMARRAAKLAGAS